MPAAPIIERTPLPTVEVHGTTHIVRAASPAFCSLLGKTPEEILGKSFCDVVPGGQECREILNSVYDTGTAVTHAHEDHSDPETACCWLYAMWPALDPKARPVGVIIQLTRAANLRHDTTAVAEALLIAGLHQHELTEVAEKLNAELQSEILERKRTEVALHEARDRLARQALILERLVVERTAKLQETIGELESFSYSVAHDMRAPLRGMQGFARLLLAEHASHLNAEAQGYLERIASSALRMDALIRDVLDYTQVSRGEAPLGPVDLDRLVRDVAATYPDWQAPKAYIEVAGVLPRVLAHEGLLTQVVSSLLSNAVKFIAPDVTPRVRIWAEDPGDNSASRPDDPSTADGAGPAPGVRVWFENNGIGIAAKYHERIFGMFQHINAADEFDGTGMGLAIARKAMERMGGRIDVQSGPDQGSRFWIDLKKASQES